MEECEALCSRVGIMVGGRFQCLGSVPRLKQRFSTAVRLEIRCKQPKVSANGADSDSDSGGGGGGGFTTYHRALSSKASAGACAAAEAAASSDAVVDRAVAFVLSTFPGSRVDERHGAFVRFEVPAARGRLSACFRTIEGAKEALRLDDYAVGQGSLEQVFIRFAKDQREETGRIAGVTSAPEGGGDGSQGQGQGTAAPLEAPQACHKASLLAHGGGGGGSGAPRTVPPALARRHGAAVATAAASTASAAASKTAGASKAAALAAASSSVDVLPDAATDAALAARAEDSEAVRGGAPAPSMPPSSAARSAGSSPRVVGQSPRGGRGSASTGALTPGGSIRSLMTGLLLSPLRRKGSKAQVHAEPACNTAEELRAEEGGSS